MLKTKKLLAIALCVVMCFGLLSACGNQTETTKAAGDTTVAPTSEAGSTTPASTGNAGEKEDQTLVVGYNPFSSKFSTYAAETAYDQDVVGMTQLGLLVNDRKGNVLLNAKDGETVEFNGTPYTYYALANCDIVVNDDGTVDYNFEMRDDVKFSDGTPLTADDAIFSMYVLSDPTFAGSSTFFAQPIVGMTEYRAGIESMTNLVLKTKKAGYEANEFYTEDEYNTFWTAFDAASVEFAQSILDYLVEAGYNTAEESVAVRAANWGFELEEAATVEDFAKTIVEQYEYDIAGINGEKASVTFSELLEKQLGDDAAKYVKGIQTGESAPNIAGIKKTGDYSFTITLDRVDATAIYQLGVSVTPLHYYGDPAQYDYENNKFGFPKGDLSMILSKTTKPMGAGAYKFIKYENKVVRFEANEYYFKGEPKIKYINFLETQDADKLNGVVTGTIDITDPSFSNDTVAAIKKANGGELNGDAIQVSSVDNLGYGYIGISASTINVGGDKGSEASKNLRKAFATIFSVYRDVSIDSYYGERATVINYPISNTSWAAPQITDDGYKVAFSEDVDGNPIYTSDMTAEQKYEAALKAALGFFEAAGYTVEDGKLTAAPEGAKMEYEILIPAGGAGDHPSFMIATESRDALEKIGMKLIVVDLTQTTDLWDKIRAQQAEMWAAAWGATLDPDMYQIYFSGMEGMTAGGSNYHYGIDDAELNELIMEARTSLDNTYRKPMYKACLDIVVDWAVEVPTYQRQNAIIFNPQKVNMSTVTPDITTFYGWMGDLETLEMND